ncbi:MAG: ankyrin repeat domain-containing protein [Elusimicrobiota bacterium]|nr:ankyrin repeat domain-containing protein [Elusimicrobiota bacterium]
MAIAAVLLLAPSLSTASLYSAAKKGDVEKVAKLIAEGAPVNKAYGFDNSRYYALGVAAHNGHVEVVRLLLEKGANPNLDDAVGFTAIHHAVANPAPNVEVVRLLLENGADPTMTRQRYSKDKRNALDMAGEHGRDGQDGMQEIRRLLAEAAGRINRKKRELEAVISGAAPAPAASPAAPPAALAEAQTLPAPVEPSYHAAERPNDLAVVVGVEGYSDIETKAPYAERDAEAVKSHLRALGVPERNVVLLKGSKASKSSIEKYVETWLPQLAKADSRVYFYFSGHGAPDVKSGQAYLVPWDGDPNFLTNTAYPVARLYKKLGELSAARVLVAMDSCFSGAGGRSVLASGARPLVTKASKGAPPAKLTVLSASESGQISGSLDSRGHGAFTYFLLEGLNAGKTTPKALADHLIPRVQNEARRLNRDQTPQLQGDGAWSLR